MESYDLNLAPDLDSNRLLLMKRLLASIFSVAATLANASCGSAEILYVTDGDERRLALADVDQGGPVTNRTTYPSAYPIIAHGESIWIGQYAGNTKFANEYNLAGDHVSGPSVSRIEHAVDAGYDPVNQITYHLANAFQSDATVFRSDGQMTAASFVRLFDVSGTRLVGIT